MKKLFCIISICACIASQSTAQFTYGLRISTSPSVHPGANHIVANRGAITESLVNISHVNYSEQIGLMGRLDREQFYFMTELLYGQTKTQVSMVGISESLEGQAAHLFTEKNSYLEIPVTAGVKLGFVEVFSGFIATRDLAVRGQTSDITGYESTMPALRMGWHSGIGVNLGAVLIDMRYQQQFSNYGKGRFLNGEELILKNAPGRLVFSLGYRI